VTPWGRRRALRGRAAPPVRLTSKPNTAEAKKNRHAAPSAACAPARAASSPAGTVPVRSRYPRAIPITTAAQFCTPMSVMMIGNAKMGVPRSQRGAGLA
jgi:hypothetical protein